MNRQTTTLQVIDTTLRDCAAGRLTFRESLEFAKGLQRLGVDTIGLPPLCNLKADTLLVRTITASVNGCVISLPVGYDEESVAAAWNALSGAEHPQLCVCLPVSTVQMEYICHLKPAKLLERVTTLVKAARAVCDDVMFIADDATRADAAFVARTISAAIEAGATSICAKDCTGTLLPDEFAAQITALFDAVPALQELPLYIQCSDALSLAAATTLAAIKVGAAGTAVTVEGGAAPTIHAIARIAADKGAAAGYACGLRVTELHRGLKQLRHLLGNDRQSVAAEDEIPAEQVTLLLTESADQAAVTAAVRALGYDLSIEDEALVYEEVHRVAAKKAVGAKELEAIIATAAMQVSPTYQLISFVINCGNQISASAHVKFAKGDEILEGVCLGDGPIDAAFRAIEQIVGRHYELDDFQISAVTQGREAVGSALVKLREDGRLYSGNGISTDVVGASIRAYVNALNKIASETM